MLLLKCDRLVQQDPEVTKRADYQEALLYKLLLQLSCFSLLETRNLD
ncbi:hypothetical protein NUACC26_036470 [Scytonema sp. NUACC26]